MQSLALHGSIFVLSLSLVGLGGCADLADDEATGDLEPAEVSADALAATITQNSGAWWNDVSNPSVNQVWAEVSGVNPDAVVTGTISFNVKCVIPASTSSTPTTLDLNNVTMISQVDSTNVSQLSVTAGTSKTLTINTSLYADGWHEMRFRCKAKETVGPETGKATAITNGFPLYFQNGKAVGSGQNHGTNYVDAHAWYDVDPATGQAIEYVYAQIKNVHALIDAPLSGSVSVSGRVWNSGATTIDHWALKVDGVTVQEFSGTTQQRTITLNTAAFPNGAHQLSVHGHGMAASGRQLAAEVKIPITISN
jgi:hypothetical protein